MIKGWSYISDSDSDYSTNIEDNVESNAIMHCCAKQWDSFQILADSFILSETRSEKSLAGRGTQDQSKARSEMMKESVRRRTLLEKQ